MMKYSQLLLQAGLLIVGGEKASAEFVKGASSVANRKLVGFKTLNEFANSAPTMYPTASAPTPYPVGDGTTTETQEGYYIGDVYYPPVPGAPTKFPTKPPTFSPTKGGPTKFPTKPPTFFPTKGTPTTSTPTGVPTPAPSESSSPTGPAPSEAPATSEPTSAPTTSPTPSPSSQPSEETDSPTTKSPTAEPTEEPTKAPKDEEPVTGRAEEEKGGKKEKKKKKDKEGDESSIEGRVNVEDRLSVESVTRPEPLTVFDIVCDVDNDKLWGTLCIVLKEAGVFEFLGIVKGKKYTLFAPTNEAFENSEYELDALLYDASALESLVSIHVTPSVLPYEKLECNKRTEMLSFYDTYTLCIGGNMIQNADGNELRNLPVIDEPVDIAATNGIIHSVTNLILPFGFAVESNFPQFFVGNSTDEEIDDDEDFSNYSENVTESEDTEKENITFFPGSENTAVIENITETQNITAVENITETENITAIENITETENITAIENITETENITVIENITETENVTTDSDFVEDSTESDVDEQSTDEQSTDGDVSTGEGMEAIHDEVVSRDEHQEIVSDSLLGNKCEVCGSQELCAVPRSAKLLFPGEGEVACADVVTRQKSLNGIILGNGMCRALKQRFDEYCLLGN